MVYTQSLLVLRNQVAEIGQVRALRSQTFEIYLVFEHPLQQGGKNPGTIPARSSKLPTVWVIWLLCPGKQIQEVAVKCLVIANATMGADKEQALRFIEELKVAKCASRRGGQEIPANTVDGPQVHTRKVD